MFVKGGRANDENNHDQLSTGLISVDPGKAAEHFNTHHQVLTKTRPHLDLRGHKAAHFARAYCDLGEKEWSTREEKGKVPGADGGL